MDSSNEEARRDELAALAAIYADDWAVEDARTGCYSLTLTANDSSSKQVLKMLFKLPSGYPTEAKPLVELSAPWMARHEKANLVETIDSLCSDNQGASMLYLIAEAAQQTLATIREREEERAAEQDEQQDNQSQEEEEIELLQVNPNHQIAQEHDQKQTTGAISHGDPLVDRRSAFQAHLAAVRSPAEASAVLAQLKLNRKVASATHNIWAYRIVSGGDDHHQQQTDCDDDGETHAGSRLLHLLTIVDARNVMVVVSRWYGGIQLGPDRFKHINNVARQLLLAQNYISAK